MHCISTLHNLPGPGGPPLTTAIGPERYGRKDLAPDTKELVQTQILVCVRVARILKLFTDMKISWIFESTVCYDEQTSVLHLDVRNSFTRSVSESKFIHP